MSSNPWYVELYDPAGSDAIWHGKMRFATVRALLSTARFYHGQITFRVMEPSNASQDELDDLQRLGAVRI